MMNIVLIGMPGSGKSTLGGRVADSLNMEFLDTDVIVERQEKRPISEIFKTDGEPYFRQLETAVIDAIAKTVRDTGDADMPNNGLMLSVGGGAAENPANVGLLRGIGSIVYIERSLAALEKNISYNGSRPLLSDREKLAELFERRSPIYAAAADRTIVNDGEFDPACEKLLMTAKLMGVESNHLVIGDPIGHTLSPMLHGAIYKEVASDENLIVGVSADDRTVAPVGQDDVSPGVGTPPVPSTLPTPSMPLAQPTPPTQGNLQKLFASASYGSVRVPAEELEGAMLDVRNGFVRGLNVTIPHKKAIIPHLDEIIGDAAAAESVNTVVNRGGRLTGYNTDMEGLRFALESRGISYEGACVCVCGTGGAAAGVVRKAAISGALKIYIIGRNEQKALEIAAPETDGVKHPDISGSPSRRSGGCVSGSFGADVSMEFVRHDFERIEITDELEKALADADIFINTTPLGMSSAGSDFANFSFLDKLREGVFVYDIVYDPRETSLLRAARGRGLSAESGLSMLVYQGILSDEFFFGAKLDRKMLYGKVQRYL